MARKRRDTRLPAPFLPLEQIGQVTHGHFLNVGRLAGPGRLSIGSFGLFDLSQIVEEPTQAIQILAGQIVPRACQ